MTLLGYLIVLTGLTCCLGAPAEPDALPKGSCREPPRFDDKQRQGDWDKEFYDPKTQAQYQCRPGFSRLGAIIYECRDGTWVSASRGQCKKKSCGHPGDIDFGTFELKNEEEFVFGAVVEYFCNDGYQMISKHRTRECTATGWSNYRPECEVRYCPPVQVNDNVNLLTTSYEEEYSVGQVIRFECKNPGQKLKGSSEIFCTSEGEWNAPPPTCEEVSCSIPIIEHGTAKKNLKRSYKEKETIEFECDAGYRASTSALLTCTKNDWSPTPVCQEIVCYQETVQNGKVQFSKETYREGEVVTLTCNDGYQIEHNPEEPRKCTARGWSPPLKCISKSCLAPKIPNGYDYEYRWSFPKQPGKSMYFYCDHGFLTSHKNDYGTIWCTHNGWNPEPKCYRQCRIPSSINAIIQHTHRSHVYTEGDKLIFQCYQGYSTLGGQTTGEMECLPDGTFSNVKCHRTCQAPTLDNGKSKINRNVFEVGANFLYECNEGYTSTNNKAEGSSECLNYGWWPKPECKEIECTFEQNRNLKTVKSGEVVHFRCPKNFKLEGSSSSQCLYYGLSPIPPICKGSGNKLSSPILEVTSPEESECPLISPPPNAQFRNNSFDKIEVECNPGYLLYGSEKLVCKDGKWTSPPWCIEKVPCSRSPPRISNGEIITETDKYYTGSTVKYKCYDGYHISGSDESTCMDGKWVSSPTCVGNPCGYPPEVNHGRAKDAKQYKHGESAAYECSPGNKLEESVAAVCLLGTWTKIPKCINSKCGEPPKVQYGVIRGVKKSEYFPNERVIYDCIKDYAIGKGVNYITCEDSAWTEPPLCKRVGQSCGPPPVVQFGDTIQTRLQSYRSDSSVTYKCANYHKLEGNKEIKCKNGEWDKEPVCREPCTVKETDMQKNNILLKYKYGEDKTKKLYSEHFDNMTFECKDEHEISNPKLLRIQCLDGVLKYPKCLKKGSCVVQPEEMTRNNIHYNKSTELEHGQTIEFECEAGMVPENDLRATCSNKQIRYPKCSLGRSCLPPNIPNASVYPDEVGNYESGSSVEIKCEDNYVLNGHINVNCENGEWNDLPQCLKPCTISSKSMDEKHIELKSEELPEIIKHGTEINAKCQANFKRPGNPIVLCNDGTMKYPRCFSGGTCRISQQDLDNNFLELDEKHENEVYYEEKESVSFKCKTGYINRTGLTGTCTKSKTEYTLTYPTCHLESLV